MSRLAAGSGAVTSRDPLDFVAEVAVRGDRLVVTNDAGATSAVAAAQGPRRLPLPGFRTFGRRLQGVDDRGRVRWTQEGAGGDVIGAVHGVAVVIGVDRQLRGVEAATGRLLWNARLDHRVLTYDARVVDDVALLAGVPGEADRQGLVAAALDARTGALRWRADLGSDVGLPLVTVAGEVVGVGAAGEVVGLRRSDGSRLWSTPLPDGHVLRALDVEDEHLVAVSTEETYGCD